MLSKNFLRYFIVFLLFMGCSPEDSGSGTSGIDKSANLKALGTSAEELLRDSEFTSIKIEMVYVTGYEPSQKTIDNLKSFLDQRTYKPDGITIEKRAVSSSGKAPFEINEIADIESRERLSYNAGDEIAVFIYFADGSNEKDTSSKVVLGSAFRNTSIVIYGETVKNIANRMNAPDKSTVESTVLNHEFGHLFGLVNLGTPLETSHEDEDSKGHCEVAGCLMNANVEFGGGLVDMVDNNNTPQLDDTCILDLQANGGK